MSNVLFKFSSNTYRDIFIEVLKKMAAEMKEQETSQLIKSAIDNAEQDVVLASNSHRHFGVFVSGQMVAEGMLKPMQVRFNQEVGSHSANVDLRELVGSKWKKIQSRTIKK